MRTQLSLSLLFCTVFLFGQKAVFQNQNSLLWEISGKAGRKSGYLFGTIHMKDNRVFNFYDSLLPKINQCDQFAIEIDPEILVRGTLEMENREDTLIDLRDGVKSKEEKDLEDKLEEALGFSLRRMDRKKLKALKRYFGAGKSKADDKPTFLDAWLCDFAKRNGKKIRGLETLEGHMEGYETIKEGGFGDLNWDAILSGKQKSMVEEMVTTYLSNDYIQIERMYAGTAGEAEMESLKKRNRAMVNAIDSLLKEGSLFSAVGSAHLAGTEGVINLLVKAGYTVKPVSAARSGFYKQLLNKNYSGETWERESFPEFGYSCSFPAKPFRIEKDNALMYTWTDIGSGINYFSMANYLPEKTNTFVAELTLKMLVDELKKSSDIKVKSSEVKSGDDFTEALLELTAGESEITKTRYIIRGNLMYTLTAEFHRNNEHPDDVERFLKSLKFIEQVDAQWKSFVSAPGAFEIYLPQEPKEKIIRSTNAGYDYETHFFTAYDIKTGGTYILRWFDLPTGTAYSSDSLVLKYYSYDFIDSKGVSLRSRQESFNRFLDYTSFNSTIIYDDFSAMKLRSVLRNGRVYTLVFNSTQENIEKLETTTFFNSFELKPFVVSKTSLYKHPADPDFKFSAPCVPVLMKGDSIPKEFVSSTYAATDPASGITYFFSVKDLPAYYYAKDNAAFYEDADALFLKAGDSLISQQNIYVGEVQMRELISSGKNVAMFKKVRYFNSGNRIYAVIAMVHPAEKELSVSNAVFRSLSYEGPERKFDFQRKKTSELLASLSSADTAVVRSAKAFCAEYNFEKEDLPELQSALRKSYADDNENGSIRIRLLDAIKKFDQPDISEFLFSLLTEVNDNALLAQKTCNDLFCLSNPANKKVVLEGMRSDKIKRVFAAATFDLLNVKEPLYSYFPEILGCVDEKQNWKSLIEFSVEMAKDGKISDKQLLEFVPKVLDQLILSAETQNNHEVPVNFINWLHVNDGANEKLKRYIQKLQEAKNTPARFEGIVLSLDNNVDVSKKVLEEVAASKEFRLQLYKELRIRERLDLFPKKYLVQREFSDADITMFLNRYEQKMDKVEFYKETIFEYAGFKQKMFVYKLTYTKNYEQKTAIGFAGPYPLKSEFPMAQGEYTGTSLQDFYPDLLDILIRQHIKKSGG